jgi:hypothetical protein
MSFSRRDYTARDYASIVSEVKAYINTNYPNLGLDWSAMSPEQLFLDIAAFIGDGHHLYIDAAFSEFFVDSMAEQQNGISLGKWVGYQAPMLTAPSVTLNYTYTQSGGPASALVTRGTVLRDRKGNSWTVLEDQTVQLAGGTIIVYQGVIVSESWGGNSEPNQEFTTSRKGVASNVDPGVTIDGSSATQVNHLVEQDDAGLYFESSFNSDTTMSLRCGDGINGCLITSSLEVSFFVTKGLDGNILPNILRGSFSPQAGVTLTYYNPFASTGGGEVASIETIRRAIPAWVSSLNTLVTREDYIALIDAYPGVQLTSVKFDPLLRRNVYYVMSTNYGTVTTQTLKYLNQFMTMKYQINSSGIFRNISFAGIILSLRVYLKNGLNVQKNEVQTEINNVLTSFFQPSEGDTIYCATGKPIRLSDIYDIIKSVDEVSYLEVDVFTRKPAMVPVNWTPTSTSLVLHSWALRPTFRLNKQNAYGLSSQIIGDLAPAQLGQRPVQLVYNNNNMSRASITAYLQKVGASMESSDWVRTTGMVPIEKVCIKMNNAYGNYRWASWHLGTEDMQTRMNQAIQTEMSMGKTAHFKVAHWVDQEEFIDTGLGYVGTSYQLDSGSFTFLLETPNGTDDDTVVTDESVICNDANIVFIRGHQLRAGTVTGFFTATGLILGEFTFVDDGKGTIFAAPTDSGSTLSNQVWGLIDYDKGIIVMKEGWEYSDFTISYSRMNFSNKTEDESQIILSPYSNTIPLLENEYPQIYSLQLEVGFE